MEEEKMVKKQMLKSMIFTFITFSIIFTVFDLIIYNQISTSIYNTIDTEISEAEKQAKSRGMFIEKLDTSSTDTENTTTNNDEIPDKSVNMANKKTPPTDSEKSGNRNGAISPRLICIVRDTDGNILNQNSIGRFYDDYINDISFDKNLLEQKYTLNTSESYAYRGINFTVTNSNGETLYVQVLANVDGEVQTVKSTIKTLITTTVIMVALSIVASYVLSQRTLKPIVESWHRQTEFVQNASHELRTPLTIIQAKQELLLQEPNKKIIDKSQDITVCLNETRRLSKLVKELMTLARADSNKLELNKEKINIDSLIKDVAEPYIEMAQMQGKKVTLKLAYNKEANVDRNKVAELLIIVLDNAIKYTSEGDDITVSTQVKDGKLLLEVADTGIGISKESLKHIFDRFYREDKARSRETGGNGLGLSIAQTIVMAHGGNIKLVKNEPKGTRVMIKL